MYISKTLGALLLQPPKVSLRRSVVKCVYSELIDVVSAVGTSELSKKVLSLFFPGFGVVRCDVIIL